MYIISTAHLLIVISFQVSLQTERTVYKQITCVSLYIVVIYYVHFFVNMYMYVFAHVVDIHDDSSSSRELITNYIYMSCDWRSFVPSHILPHPVHVISPSAANVNIVLIVSVTTSICLVIAVCICIILVIICVCNKSKKESKHQKQTLPTTQR